MAKRARAKFRVGQVVAVEGVPETGDGDEFLGYKRIIGIEQYNGRTYYNFGNDLIREGRLRELTAREKRHAK